MVGSEASVVRRLARRGLVVAVLQIAKYGSSAVQRTTPDSYPLAILRFSPRFRLLFPFLGRPYEVWRLAHLVGHNDLRACPMRADSPCFPFLELIENSTL